MNQPRNHFRVIRSETVYEGRVFSVRRDRVLMPTGREASLDVVSHGGAVVIVPVDQDGMVWFVRQYRHAAEIELLELPAGTLDLDEAPVECAARELREEIGMAAGTLLELGSFYLAPGYSTEYMYVFLARDLTPAPLAADEDEVLEPEPIASGRALEMVGEGIYRDGKTLAALHLARSHLTPAPNLS